MLYGPAASGKSVAAAAAAHHLSRRHGLPVAAHFCSVSDVRSLCPIGEGQEGVGEGVVWRWR